jgi:cation diffusion facilitator CzcD-associated flavoprotein CzcO
VEAQRVSVTQTADTAGLLHDVVIVGAGAAAACARTALTETGITGFIFDKEVVSSVFDDDTDTWALITRSGETCRGRIVIATGRRLFVPWIPTIQGQNDFRGVSFHAAAWDHDFDSAGKRVAIVGADSTAGREIERLVASAAVKVFAYPPRRFIPVLLGPTARAKRWLRRHAEPLQRATTPRRPELVRSPIETMTSEGIRTCDGAQHDVDAIIYGTGFSLADQIADDTLVGAGGLTIRQAWRDGMEPYLGVAVHGFPNYFLITGPDDEAQVRYIARCVKLMARRDSTRIAVRHSTQQVFNERVHIRRPTQHRPASAFELSSSVGVEDNTYDGPATLTIAGVSRPVRVRLIGYVDPIDGQYHWQGTIFDSLSADLLRQTRAVTLIVGERSAPARIIEESPQGTHTIAGMGMPPFTLGNVEITVSQP